MTIGEILKGKGIILFREKDGAWNIKYADIPTEKPTKCYARMIAEFKRLDEIAKEQIQKAIIGGADAEYKIKSSKELGDREPNFSWVNGVLTYIPSRRKKEKVA